ncbi:MAG: hypothetical protein R3B90_05020 [Planctomycetaceae bacterium]
MSQTQSEESRPWGLYITVAAIVLAVALGLFFAGSTSDPDDASNANVDADAVLQKQCEDRLKSIMLALDPTQLGVTTNRIDVSHDLNLWVADCGRDLTTQPIAEDADEIKRLLTDSAQRRVAAEEYSQRDASHVRTMLLSRQIAAHVTEEIVDPLQQSLALLRYLRRNVLPYRDLLPGSDQVAPPMTPHEALLSGSGTIEQQVWTLAELLRQIQIDAVIIEPVAEDGTPPHRHCWGCWFQPTTASRSS